MADYAHRISEGVNASMRLYPGPDHARRKSPAALPRTASHHLVQLQAALNQRPSSVGLAKLSTQLQRRGALRPTSSRSTDCDGVMQLLLNRAAWQQATRVRVGNRGVHNPEILQIDALLDHYHTLTNVNDPAHDHRMQTLTDIETTAYRWYNRRFNVANPPRSARLNAFYDLLDEVAAEHEAQVNQITAGGMALPIPNVAGVPALLPGTAQHAQAQTDWQHLANETGNVIFSTQNPTGTETYPGFKNRMLPHFARLMRTPTGRQLIHELVTNAPGNLSAADLALNYNKMTVRPTGAAERAQGRVAAAGVKKFEAYRSDDADRPGGGRGIGSYLSAPPVGAETSATREGGIVDTRNTNLLSPMFIVLAHEMIHAVHNQRGVNRNRTPVANWGNLEEKVTITGRDQHGMPVDALNEQAIRDEYGLNQQRFGH
jgi:hypothetical protein